MDEISGKKPNMGKAPVNPQNPELITMAPVARQSLVTWFAVSYVLIVFFPIASIIMAYIKRPECAGDSVLYSHAQNQIKICWILFIGYLISLILSFVVIGIFTMLALGIWIIYRVIKGFSELQKNMIVK